MIRTSLRCGISGLRFPRGCLPGITIVTIALVSDG
jgi:hypothetical protein